MDRYKCPNCGNTIRQTDEAFCSRSCYLIWWRKTNERRKKASKR